MKKVNLGKIFEKMENNDFLGGDGCVVQGGGKKGMMNYFEEERGFKGIEGNEFLQEYFMNEGGEFGNFLE